jgi:ABC-type sugar transport system permease subunit
MVYARLIRELILRVVLSPMMSHAVLGRPSLRTLAITPMYVYTSVVTTWLESMFATHSLLNVL